MFPGQQSQYQALGQIFLPYNNLLQLMKKRGDKSIGLLDAFCNFIDLLWHFEKPLGEVDVIIMGDSVLSCSFENII